MQSLTNSPRPKPETNWHLFDAAVKLNVMAKTPAMESLVKQIRLHPKPKPTSTHRLDLFDAAAQAKTPDRSLHMPVSQLVGKLTDYPKFIADRQTGLAMTIEQLTVNIPIELKVIVNPDGTVNIKGSPPTQLVQTTVMPVFHHMRLKVVRKDDE
jgi:hypothetical protein